MLYPKVESCKGEFKMNDLLKPKLIFYTGSSLLEGPCWDQNRTGVLFVSIEQNCIYHFSLLTGIVKTFYVKGQVGCAVFENDDNILAAVYTGIYRININTGEEEFIAQLISSDRLRYNDGKLDAKGRFIVGTTGYKCYAEKQNFLYSWDGSSGKVLLENVSISNGIAFSLDNKYMYYVDTPTQKVSRFFYDLERGDIKFDADIINITDGSVPDGICTDIDDMLWVAQWGGSKVSKWNPYTGEKLMEIELPCKNVTSCCIGGEDNRCLFVTTAQHDDGTESEFCAGGLFEINLR